MSETHSIAGWLSWVPAVHPETGVQQVKGKWMAATADNALHSFEDSGERIIELIDGRRTVGEIVDRLCEEFEVERPECEQQTVQFIELLVQKKVLAPK